MCWISIKSFLCFRIFSASFLITFLSHESATSSNTHVPFSLSRIMMSGLLLEMGLSVCPCWFYNMVILYSWSVSTNFGTWSYQCSLSSFTPISLYLLKSTWTHTLPCPFTYFSFIIIIIIIWMSLVTGLFSWYFSWTSGDPHRLGFKLHTVVLPVLCVMFQVYHHNHHHHAFVFSNHMVLNDGVINEKWIAEDVKGNGSVLIQDSIPPFACRVSGKPRNLLSGHPFSGQQSERGTPPYRT